MNDIKLINEQLTKALEEFKLLPNDKKLETYGELIVFTDIVESIKADMVNLFSTTGISINNSRGDKISIIPEKPAQQSTQVSLKIDWDKYMKECPAPIMKNQTQLVDKNGIVLWRSDELTAKDVFMKVVPKLDIVGASNSEYYFDHIHDLQKEITEVIETPKKNAMMRVTKAK